LRQSRVLISRQLNGHSLSTMATISASPRPTPLGMANADALAGEPDQEGTTSSDQPASLTFGQVNLSSSRSPRCEGSQVGRDRNDIVLRQVGHCVLHQCHSGAGVRSILYTDELAGNVDWL
jgi:hypothetical protein